MKNEPDKSSWKRILYIYTYIRITTYKYTHIYIHARLDGKQTRHELLEAHSMYACTNIHINIYI